ncbi:hypothetical protein Taro_035158 [Colocasia esculenta]|uniref:Uncharacterized protein n=1 Tax=Colocasia esculenta TaxID=4460 RepID=A0A843VZP4_COLES|nr:hypothetical protein [Colocasia esculenta]
MSTGRDTLYTWRIVLTGGHHMSTPQTTEEGKAQLAENSPADRRQHRLPLTRTIRRQRTRRLDPPLKSLTARAPAVNFFPEEFNVNNP